MVTELSRSWARQGHEVVVLAGKYEPHFPASETIDGVKVLRFSMRRVRIFGTLWLSSRMGLWIRRHLESCDIVCVSMLKHAAAASLFACQGTHVPVVLRTEGGGVTGDVAWQESSPARRYVRSICQRAAAVIALNESIRQELLQSGYDPSRLHTIPNGVPIPENPWKGPQVHQFRKRLGLADVTTLCFTGRLRAAKGLSDFVRAVPPIERAVGAVQLLLVGDGPARPELRELSAALHLESRVHVTGYVDDVEPFLRASDLFVLPSYAEGRSIALLEALVLGLPSIASDIEANRGILPDDLLPRFSVRNPEHLAQVAVQRLEKSRAGPSPEHEARRLLNDEYGIDTIARRYLDLFHDLLRERDGARLKVGESRDAATPLHGPHQGAE